MKQTVVRSAVVLMLFFAGCICGNTGLTAEKVRAIVNKCRIKGGDTEIAVLIQQADGSEESVPRLPDGISISDLKQDLLRHTELIPFKGVLGGTPHYFGDTFRCLPGHYVYIYAEDGHICADMILSYDMKKDKSISWKLVAYNLNCLGWETAFG